MMAWWSVVGIRIGDGFQTAEGRSLKTGPDLHSLGGGGFKPSRTLRVTDPTKSLVTAWCISSAQGTRLLNLLRSGDLVPRNHHRIRDFAIEC